MNTKTIDAMKQALEALDEKNQYTNMAVHSRFCAKIALNQAIKREEVQTVEPIHTDDIAVDRFAAAMKAKLAVARAKGRTGWDDPEQCTVEHLSELLHGHVAKGDPVDAANFCMMLSEWGSGIAPDQPKEEAQPVAWISPSMVEVLLTHPSGHTVLCGRRTSPGRTIPLFTHPAAKQPLPTERSALMTRLRDFSSCQSWELADALMEDAADMLAADAQEIEHTRRMYEQAVQGRSDFRQALREARAAQQVAVPQGPEDAAYKADYWKRMHDEVRSELIRVQAAPQPPQSERVPMTEAEIEAGREKIYSTGNPYCVTLKSWTKAARFAEAHHGIGVKL